MMKIKVYSHFFSVSGYNREGYEHVRKYAFEYAEYDYRPVMMARRYGETAKPVLKRIYAGFAANRRFFHFHVNLLAEFLETFKDSSLHYELEYMPNYKANPCNIEVLPQYVPRDYQIPLIEYILAEGSSKLLNLQTGRGKTMIALYAAAQRKGKILVSIETRFFNLWEEALCPNPKQILNLSLEEVLFVQGTKELIKLMELALTNQLKHVKVIVIAARTLALYIESYEKFNGNLEGLYPVTPEYFYELLDIQTRIKDEVHLSLFANLREELYMNIPKSLSLSATLEDGSFRDKILSIMFPQSMRPAETEYLKYIDVYCLFYGLSPKTKHVIKTGHRGGSDYSHNAFEQSIMKKKWVYLNYLKIITDWLEKAYLNVRKPGMKAAIFFESTKLATDVCKDLKRKFPKLTFGRYVASLNDDYDACREVDVLITTVKSFGTGFDLPNLYCALMTNAIRAPNINQQTLGRLRELKNYPGEFPKFYYLTCQDIPKHVEYHKAKKHQFSGKVKSHNEHSLLMDI